MIRRTRAIVYTGDFQEYCTGWFEHKTYDDLVIMALNGMTEEWYEVSGRKIVVEEELKRVRFTVCPHCLGPMIKSDMGHDYCCRKCGRGWRINRRTKIWHALFSAGMETYPHDEVIDDQRHRTVKVITYE